MAQTPGAALIVELRTRMNLTQEQLAAKSGLGLGMLRKIEQGSTVHPHRRNLEILDRALQAEGQVLAAFPPRTRPASVNRPGDPVSQHQSERRLLLSIGRAVEVLLDAAAVDGEEDLAELLDELRSAMRAVQ